MADLISSTAAMSQSYQNPASSRPYHAFTSSCFAPFLAGRARPTRASSPFDCLQSPRMTDKNPWNNCAARGAGLGCVKFNLIDKIEQLTDERIVG